jgi:hypothetical protein
MGGHFESCVSSCGLPSWRQLSGLTSVSANRSARRRATHRGYHWEGMS